jgi:HEAT repeat protein
LVIAKEVRTPTPEASDIKPEVLNDQAAARAEARKRLEQAVEAIRSLLKPENPVEARRGAARALTDLTRSVGEQDRANERVAELQTMNDIEVYHAYTTLTQVAVGTLTDADARVRETGVGAIASVAKIVDDRLQTGSPLDRFYLPNTTLKADEQKKLAEAQKNLGETIQREVHDLQTALGGAVATHQEGAGIGLGNLIRDPSPTVRLKAVDAIREMALLYRRVRPLERPTAPPPVPSGSQVKLERPVVQVAEKPAPSPSEPVFEGLQSAAASLPAALSDPHAKTRITAAEDIELLGPAVVAGVPGISESLVAALSDRDRFVRWAAARTISKLGIVNAKDAVPALAKMLVDPDFDLQMVATTALADYGAQAKAAVPNLIRAVERGDSDVKTSAMRTLAAIGTDGAAAIPATTRALRDEKPQTRKQAADLLGRFGPLAESAIPALKAATQDENVDVRRAAAQAILNITRK